MKSRFHFVRHHCSLLAYGGLFLMVAFVYGALAIQGPLPFMSPDETATFVTARTLAHTGHLSIMESHAGAFSWLHPRSFVAQYGQLIPVSFPVWPVLLALVAWIGHGGLVLWVAVLVAASFVIPLAWLLENELTFSRLEAFVITLAVAFGPTMILYGNRSLFGLLSQLAFMLWALWGLSTAQARIQLGMAGAVAAIAIGIRPIELVWMGPIFLGAAWFFRTRTGVSSKAYVISWLVGFLLVAACIVALHTSLYGAPWQVGYFLRDVPVPSSYVASASPTVAWWRPFFPYGFSPHKGWQNIRGAWMLGWWPWMLVWLVSGGVWVWKRHSVASVAERLCFVVLLWLTGWLAFYYGQGRYADHVGGQAFHLGSSLFRYLTPVFVVWMLWVFWVLRSVVSTRVQKGACVAVAVFFSVLGMHWAFADPVDGLWQNRHERQEYAHVREIVLQTSPSSTIWLSDRSDKIVFPERASVAPVPPLAEIRRYLQTTHQPVWMYRRPPGQQERDAWYAEGLEFVEKERFDREMVYEVKLRAGF